jgi:hypothetical protein
MGAPSVSADDGDVPTTTRPHVRIAEDNGGSPDDATPEPMMARNETFSPLARRKTRAPTFRTVDDFEDYKVRPGWHRMFASAVWEEGWLGGDGC